MNKPNDLNLNSLVDVRGDHVAPVQRSFKWTFQLNCSMIDFPPTKLLHPPRDHPPDHRLRERLAESSFRQNIREKILDHTGTIFLSWPGHHILP